MKRKNEERYEQSYHVPSEPSEKRAKPTDDNKMEIDESAPKKPLLSFFDHCLLRTLPSEMRDGLLQTQNEPGDVMGAHLITSDDMNMCRIS